MKATAVLSIVLSFLFPTFVRGQFHDTCETHSWSGLKVEANGGSSVLCKGVAALEMGQAERGRTLLLGIIKQSPRSDAAFEAHERLLRYYARLGRVREASHEIAALLAMRPNDPGVLEMGSLFQGLGEYPDMSVEHLQTASFTKSATDGTLNFPFRVHDKAATFYLDTGANLSVISDAEARALGLAIRPVTTKLQDSGGTKFSMQIADVDELDIGPIRLRHVPFLVLPAANPPFNELPLENQGLLGIQVAIALQTIRLATDGHVEVALPVRPQADGEPISFDDMYPVLHVTYMGKVIPFALDTGAEHTALEPPFATEFPDVVARGIKKTHDTTGMAGSVTLNAVELTPWSLTLGKTKVSVDAMVVQMDKTTDESGWAAGNLGIDLLKKTGDFTLDFKGMRLITAP
jgi:predicted aspartyl protease